MKFEYIMIIQISILRGKSLIKTKQTENISDVWEGHIWRKSMRSWDTTGLDKHISFSFGVFLTLSVESGIHGHERNYIV